MMKNTILFFFLIITIWQANIHIYFFSFIFEVGGERSTQKDRWLDWSLVAFLSLIIWLCWCWFKHFSDWQSTKLEKLVSVHRKFVPAPSKFEIPTFFFSESQPYLLIFAKSVKLFRCFVWEIWKRFDPNAFEFKKIK